VSAFVTLSSPVDFATISQRLAVATSTLYRPVGEKELALVRASGWRSFPTRLPEQPIFYPVLEEAYATQIARDWNTRDGGTGFVLKFEVDSEYLSRFTIQTAGSRIHREYWIPAEDLDEFNRHIDGTIHVVAEYHSGESE
jgi:hypothetical protein